MIELWYVLEEEKLVSYLTPCKAVSFGLLEEYLFNGSEKEKR